MQAATKIQGNPTPLAWRSALLASAAAFVASRLIVFLCVIAPALLEPAASQGIPSDRVVLAFDAGEDHAQLNGLSRVNDAGWYHGISTAGYETRPFTAERQANWAFFPMLPVAWAIAASAFGDGLFAALLFPNLAFLIGLVGLHLLCQQSGRDPAHAGRAVFAVALLPSSYFFSFPWTEPLFFCFSVWCFVFAYGKAWWLMAIAGFAAATTRFNGLFLVPALIFLWGQRNELHARSLGACLLIPLGTAVFAAHLATLTGNPLAFVDIQAAWGRSLQLPVRAIGIVALRPWELAIDWNFRYLNLVAAGLALLAMRHFVRRREFAFALLLGLGVGTALMTGTLTSMSRYASALFPLAIAIADMTASPLRERVWWSASVALLACMSLAFGAGLSFAAA